MEKMNNDQFIKFIPNEEGLLALGAQLAPLCGDSAIIFLYGNLGAGKTTFTRGFLRGLGYKGKVKSPTYTLVEPYEINNQIIYHFDFYRLQPNLNLLGFKIIFLQKLFRLLNGLIKV
jgi:tRNA threonylcarbamoyladenosine biosynthesis protein TsaE